MADYKISQTPSNRKRPAPSRRKVAKRASSRSLSPQLVLGGIILVLVLVLGGFAWAHFFAGSPKTAGGSSASKSATKPVPSGTRAAVTNALDSKKATALSGYYASQVHVVMTRQGINQTLASGNVNRLISDLFNGSQGSWNWNVSTGDLSTWQNGPYGQYFDGTVIVGQSSDGTVVSIGVDSSGQITTIFVAPTSDLTNPTTPGSGSTTSSPSDTSSTDNTTSGTGTTGSTSPSSGTNLDGQYSE
jgi:hypothetical protein